MAKTADKNTKKVAEVMKIRKNPKKQEKYTKKTCVFFFFVILVMEMLITRTFPDVTFTKTT